MKNDNSSVLKIILSTVAMLGCLAIAVTISGCGLENVLPESEKDKALEYLNTKYSAYEDTFTPVSYIPSDWSDPDSTVTFKSQKYDDQIVTVFIHSDKENSYSDDYYQLYMADEVEQYFVNVAKEHGINAKTSIKFSSTGAYDEKVDAKWTFEDYVNEGLGRMISYYFVTDTMEEVKANELVKDLARKGIKGRVDIYLCSNEEDLQKIIENEELASEKLTKLYSWYIWDKEEIKTYE